jgi:biotin-(acetyl-CoA carboxylase) ligase
MSAQEQVNSRGRGRAWRFSPKYFAVWVTVVAICASALAYFTSLPLFGAMAIVAGALVVVGLVAEVEDRSPGGFLSEPSKAATLSKARPGDA